MRNRKVVTIIIIVTIALMVTTGLGAAILSYYGTCRTYYSGNPCYESRTPDIPCGNLSAFNLSGGWSHSVANAEVRARKAHLCVVERVT